MCCSKHREGGGRTRDSGETQQERLAAKTAEQRDARPERVITAQYMHIRLSPNALHSPNSKCFSKLYDGHIPVCRSTRKKSLVVKMIPLSTLKGKTQQCNVISEATDHRCSDNCAYNTILYPSGVCTTNYHSCVQLSTAHLFAVKHWLDSCPKLLFISTGVFFQKLCHFQTIQNGRYNSK